MKYKSIWLSLIALCSCAFASSSEQGDSLKFYLELSAKNNPLVLQKLDEYKAALQKVPQAGSLTDPELNVGVYLSPMELMAGNQVADIQLMQMFPWFGVLKNAKDEMSLMAKAKFESFREAQLQVFYDVQRTWFEMQKIQQDIRVSEKNIEILKTIERLTLAKFRSGTSGGGSLSATGGNMTAGVGTSGSSSMQNMGGVSAINQIQSPAFVQGSSMGVPSGGSGLADLYRIQIEIGDLENNIVLLRNRQNTVVAQFNSYLNRSVTSPVLITDDLRPDTLDITHNVLSESMLSGNPMIGMLKYEQQSLDARSKMINRMGYPMLGIGLDYSLINKSDMSTSSMNGKDMIMPMVKVTLPIYRKKYKAMQIETGFLKSASEQGLKAASNDLQTEYYDAMQLYEDAGRRMKLYENQKLLAKKTLDIMIKTFSVSGAGLTDVLQIRQQMFDYEFKKIEAVADYNTSIVWLKKLMVNSQIQ